MIKLPLEKTLERRLPEIGVTLQERVYGIDLQAAFQADKLLFIDSINEEKEWLEAEYRKHGHSAGDARLLANIFAESSLTPYQQQMNWGVFPVFRRESTNMEGFLRLFYVVYSDEDVVADPGIADRLMQEGRIGSQHIDFVGTFGVGNGGKETISGPLLYQFGINTELNRKDNQDQLDHTDLGDIEVYYRMDPHGDEVMEALKRIEMLKYKRLDAEEFTDRLMDLLKLGTE